MTGMAARGLVVEDGGQGGVVPVEGAQDLASHVFVLAAVVADVEVGELLLAHAPLVAHPLLDVGQHLPGGGIVLARQAGPQGLHRLAVPVLAHEREAEAAQDGRVGRGRDEELAGHRLGAGPVAGLEPHGQEAEPGRPRARAATAGPG